MGIKEVEGVSIISLGGDFISEVDQVKLRTCVRELAGEGKIHALIDLTKVEHINSCGLGSIVCSLTTLRKAGGDLKLVGLGKFVKDLLRITQLDMIFPVYPTLEKALKDMRAKKGSQKTN